MWFMVNKLQHANTLVRSMHHTHMHLWGYLRVQHICFSLHIVLPASILSLPCGVPLSACLSLNNLYRNHGAMDRHDYPSRSRSADQRPTIERHPTSRSRSTERPHDSSLMRSMPSLPSGRSAPPSPALTRCDPDRRRWAAQCRNRLRSVSYASISQRQICPGGERWFETRV